MHGLASVPLALTLFVLPTDAYPPPAHSQKNKVISRDLQLLTLSYEQCHVHVRLYNSQVDVEGIRTPYTLTKSQVSYSFSEVLRVGLLAYPQMRYMTDHCQATFQVLPSKQQIIGG